MIKEKNLGSNESDLEIQPIKETADDLRTNIPLIDKTNGAAELIGVLDRIGIPHPALETLSHETNLFGFKTGLLDSMKNDLKELEQQGH